MVWHNFCDPLSTGQTKDLWQDENQFRTLRGTVAAVSTGPTQAGWWYDLNSACDVNSGWF